LILALAQELMPARELALTVVALAELILVHRASL